jgi:hypothetical protein
MSNEEEEKVLKKMREWQDAAQDGIESGMADDRHTEEDLADFNVPTVEEARRLKQELQEEIEELLISFSERTGTRVTDIDLDIRLDWRNKPIEYLVSLRVTL